jgi:CheY-like chemotaxis protein
VNLKPFDGKLIIFYLLEFKPLNDFSINLSDTYLHYYLNPINKILNENKNIILADDNKLNNKETDKYEKEIIILADDNKFINDSHQNIIVSILNEMNILEKFEIIKVLDGYDILYLYLNDSMRKRIRIIITDENMDFLNGSEAIKFIRNFEKLKKEAPKILISLSGNEVNSENEYFDKDEINYILNKPFSKNVCRKIISDLDLKK